MQGQWRGLPLTISRAHPRNRWAAVPAMLTGTGWSFSWGKNKGVLIDIDKKGCLHLKKRIPNLSTQNNRNKDFEANQVGKNKTCFYLTFSYKEGFRLFTC